MLFIVKVENRLALKGSLILLGQLVGTDTIVFIPSDVLKVEHLLVSNTKAKGDQLFFKAFMAELMAKKPNL